MAHFSWFVLGLIQPLHALIILLMHLSTCPNICEEEISRHLLDQIMSLRVNRILNGCVGPTKAPLRGDDRPQRANSRYLIMVQLRNRVWKKVGWDCDGKGKDPWAGRAAQGEVVGGIGETFHQKLDLESRRDDDSMLGLDGDWDINNTTGLESLDNILAGDPMDLFQWDSWESLASEFFAS
jgi:hypothetical protein